MSAREEQVAHYSTGPEKVCPICGEWFRPGDARQRACPGECTAERHRRLVRRAQMQRSVGRLAEPGLWVNFPIGLDMGIATHWIAVRESQHCATMLAARYGQMDRSVRDEAAAVAG